MARLLTAADDDEMPMGGGIIMKQQQTPVDHWVAKQQSGQRLASDRHRRETIRQWVMVAVAASVIMAVMVIFGES